MSESAETDIPQTFQPTETDIPRPSQAETDISENDIHRPTFRHSEMMASLFRQSEDTRRSSLHITTHTEMKITAMEPSEGAPIERQRDYKGRYRVRSNFYGANDVLTEFMLRCGQVSFY